MASEYLFLENIDIEVINSYAVDNWQVVHTNYQKISKKFDVLLVKHPFIEISTGSMAVFVRGNTNETLISNIETGREFYVNKTISYGDILMITFVMIFLVFGITAFLLNFFIPKFINFKR